MANNNSFNLNEAYASIYEKSESNFEAWVNDLVNEGYDLSEYTWDEMAQIYMEGAEEVESGQDPSKSTKEEDRKKREEEIRRQTAPRGTGVPTRTQGYGGTGLKDSVNLLDITRGYSLREGRRTNWKALAQESQKRKEDQERGRPEAEIETQGRLMMGPFRPSASQAERAAGGRERLKVRGKVPKKGGKDMFEHVLNHLISEGYADNVDSALVIMSNMSEGWKQSIVEQQSTSSSSSNPNLWNISRSLGGRSAFQVGRTSPPDMSTPQDKKVAERIRNTPLGARLTSPGGPIRDPGPATGPNGFLNR